MLLTDTNILQRICLGTASRHVQRLQMRRVRLATTAHNAFELRNNLISLGLSIELAEHETNAAITAFELLAPDEYQHLQAVADARLDKGGKSDWPLLAAALATGGQIWSEDRDFFGTGVPVWTTVNLRFVEHD